MNTIALLHQIQYVVAAVIFLGLVLSLFRRKRPVLVKAVNPIQFIIHLAATVFCSCLALRAGLETPINLIRFWVGAIGAVLGLLVVLLSYRALWFKFVEAATRPPWPMPSAGSESAPSKPTPPIPPQETKKS